MTTRCRVVILCFNSAAIIGRTLAQARRLDPRPFVVDSFSTDGTLALLQTAGCEVVQRAFSGYSEQRNWAIAQVGDHAQWQLHLDADEVLDDRALTEIAALVAQPQTARNAYLLRRVDYFLGQRLRFSGLNPWHLRLFRSGSAVCEDRRYDQHFVSVTPAGRLSGCMHDHNSLSLAEWTARHNRWSDLEAAETAQGPSPGGLRATPFGDPRERTRWLKRQYYRLPGAWRAAAYFAYRYLLCGGFLDGRVGFYFAFFQAFWFRLLVDAKRFEASRGGRSPGS